MWHRAVALLPVLWAGTAVAHGPAPAVLEVLAADPTGPTLLRTSIGLAAAQGDGTFRFVCPSQWGGAPSPFAAALEDESVMGVVTSGAVYLSVDRACQLAPVEDLGGWYAEGIAAGRDRLWITARDDAAQPHAVVIAIDALGATSVEDPFDAFMPDSVRADGDRVWVSGSRPSPGVWSRDPGGAWRVYEGLPDVNLARLSVRALGDDELWLAATADTGQELWRTAVDHAQGRVEVVEEAGPYELVHGPARWGAEWLAVAGGQLLTRASVGVSSWVEGPQVDWTCLSEGGGRLYACSLAGLQTVDEVTASGVATTMVFRFTQLGPAPPGCPAGAAAEACDLDWAHVAGEAGWLDSEPATDPDGERRPVIETPPLESQGCAAAGATPLAALVVLAGRRAWRRRGASAGTTCSTAG